MESDLLGKQLERLVKIIDTSRLQIRLNPVIDDPESQTAHVQTQLMGFASDRMQWEKPPFAFHFQELDVRAGIGDPRDGFHPEARLAPDDPVFGGPLVFPDRRTSCRER